MSMSGLHRLTSRIDPIGHAAVEALTGIDKAERQQAEMDAKADAADAEARAAYDQRMADLSRSTDVETRRQNRGRAAGAAGATRSDNAADLLGYVPAGPKRKSAARQILG